MARSDEAVKPREQARTRSARRAVVAAAAELFVEQGYVTTTIDAISERSAVPAPTIYRLYAGKIAILKAVLDTSIGGDDEDVAVSDRPALAALFAEATPDALVAGTVAVTTGINRRSNAVFHVIATAAGADVAAAALLDTVTAQRRKGQRNLTRALARRKALRPGLSEPRAADIVYALLAPELYRLLVTESGWTPRRYQDWLGATLRDQLLAQRDERR